VSVLGQARAPAGEDNWRGGNFGIALLLGIAYAASIGGFATLIGTPTNLAFKEQYQQFFQGSAPEITFGGWMLLALPLSIAMLLVAWLLLSAVVYPVGSEAFLGGREVIDQERRKLGPMRPAEWQMAVIFAATSGLWIFREPLPGWG